MTHGELKEVNSNIDNSETPRSRTLNWVMTQDAVKPEQQGRKIRKVKIVKGPRETRLIPTNQFRESCWYRPEAEKFFEFLRPCLEAARSFPGPVSFEIHIGRLTPPEHVQQHNMPAQQHGDTPELSVVGSDITPTPLSTFSGRIASLHAALEQSLNVGNPTEDFIFVRAPSHEICIIEFRMLNKGRQPVIITFDTDKNLQVTNSIKLLAAINIHFPNAAWDASGRLNGSIYQEEGVDINLDSTIQLLKESIVIQHEQSLMNLTFRLSEGELKVVETLVKKSSYHRFISNRSQSSKLDDIRGGDIFVKITEVQSLCLQPDPGDVTTIHAANKPSYLAMKDGRLWHEVAVISSSVEAALLENAESKAGENTNKWKIIYPNECNSHISLLLENKTHIHNPSPSLMEPESIIEMHRVTGILIERMEALEQSQSPHASNISSPSTGVFVRASSKTTTSNTHRAITITRNSMPDMSPREGFDSSLEFW